MRAAQRADIMNTVQRRDDMSADAMRAVQSTYGEYAAHLAAHRDVSPSSLEAGRVALRARFAPWLPRNKIEPILDLGCGYGAFLFTLHREGYAQATGVDMDAGMTAMARSLGVSNVQTADASTFLQAHPSEFQRIFALDVIEHVPTDETADLMLAIHGALQPGGAFIMQSPNADGPFGSRYRYEDLTHTTAFTGTSARQLLTAAGFERVEALPVEPLAHGVKSLGRRILWKAIKQVLRLYLLAETGSAQGYLLTQNLLAVGWRAADERAER